MVLKFTNVFMTFCILFCALTSILAQEPTNDAIEANIEVSDNQEFKTFSATVLNKLEVPQNLRYVFSTIKKDSLNNAAKNDQSARFTLKPFQQGTLAKTTVNSDIQQHVVLLLLIYNLDDEVVASDRVELNPDESSTSDIAVKMRLLEKLKQESQSNTAKANESDGGMSFRGLVTEDTKTKAGRDFYVAFSSAYRLEKIQGDEVVSITEEAALGRSTKIKVLVGNTLVWQFFARTKLDYLKQMSDIAIARVRRYFILKERNQQNLIRY